MDLSEGGTFFDFGRMWCHDESMAGNAIKKFRDNLLKYKDNALVYQVCHALNTMFYD